MMGGAKELLADAWRLAAPYYRSNERWFARFLLATIVALSLFLVGLNVVLSYCCATGSLTARITPSA